MARHRRASVHARPTRAAAGGKTFRAGIWAAITFAPLGYAVGLAEAMRRFSIDGTLFDGEVAGGAGEILYESLTFSWVFGPVLAWPFAVLGAALGPLSVNATATSVESGNANPRG